MLDPSSLVPAAPSLPAPWGVIEGLRFTLFLIHILGVSLLLGGTFIAAAAALRPGLLPQGATRATAHALPTLMGLVVNLGVPPLLFLQVAYGHLFYTSSILMGWWWLAVVGVLLLAYTGLYMHDARLRTGAASRLAAASAVLLAAAAFLYVCNLSQTQAPALWTAAVGSVSGTRLPLADPALIPRWLHFLVGSLAIAGLALAVAGHKGWLMASDQAVERFGLRLFARATLVQFAVGLWLFLSQPPAVKAALLGGEAWATSLLGLGAILAPLALVLALRRAPLACAAALLALAAVMGLIREAVRLTQLSGLFHPARLAVETQAGPLAVFLAVLAVGLYALWWLVSRFRGAGKEA